MFSLAIRNFSARPLRALSTALAVFFGVAMVAGTLMLTDSVNGAFDDIFTEVNEGIDVRVTPKVTVEGDFGESFTRALPEELVEDVRAVDGVAVAEGVIADDTITIVDEEGERIGPPAGGPPHIALSVPTEDDAFSAFTLVEGEDPQAANEAVIDSITAQEEGYTLGDNIRVTGAAGEADYTVSGIAEFGSGASLGGASLIQFVKSEAQRLTGKEGRVDEIDVTAADGIAADALALRVSGALPANLVEVETGAQAADSDAAEIQDSFSFLTTALLVFAGVAVFVGAFLIFNTFSITVAQRAREFAMLRTLGASSRQVLVAVLVEAALVGVLASVLGIAGGFAFVELIKAAFVGARLGASDRRTHAHRDDDWDRARGRRADDRGRGAQPRAAGDPGGAARGAGRIQGQHGRGGGALAPPPDHRLGPAHRWSRPVAPRALHH